MSHHQGHIFISYKTEQRDKAFSVRDKLHEWGYETWLDVDRLQPGGYWADDINEALKTCWACLGIMTPISIKSRYVTNEWDMAIMKDKLFIPLMFEKTEPHYKYVDIQYMDFTKPNIEPLFELLKNRLDTYTPDSNKNTNDPYHDYLQKTYERINKFLGSTLLHTLRDDEGRPEPIKLLQERTEGAVLFERQEEVDPFFLSAGIEQEILRKFDDFSVAFNSFNGRLLLLGEAGAGKTTTLFHYARDAVVKRRLDPSAPLPILGSIVTWNSEKQPQIVDWLSESFGTPQNTKEILQSGKALLLLDGLDELGDKREIEHTEKDPKTGKIKTETIRYDPRNKFIEAIGKIKHDNQLLLTCRVKDYSTISEKVSLNGAVALQPLTNKQLADYLKDYPQIYSSIQNDAHLRELASTPLLLSLITFAFEKLDESLKSKGDLSAGDVRDAIFEAYCRQRYEHEARKKNANLPFSYQEMMDILGELAMRNAMYQRSDKDWTDKDRFTEANVLLHYDFEIALKDLDSIQLFQAMAVELNILASLNDSDYRFVHLLLRDFLVYNFALPIVQYSNKFDEQTILGAIEALGEIGDKRVIEPFTHSLNNKSSLVRRSIIQGLGRIGGEEAIEPLVFSFSDADWQARNTAIKAITKIGVSAVDALVKGLSNDDPLVREAAAKALGEVGDTRAIVSLHNTFNDQNLLVRRSVAQALCKVNDTSSFDILLPALADTDRYLRKHVITALGSIGDLRATIPLLQASEDDHKWIRASCIKSLGKIGDQRAVERLIRALDDKEVWIQEWAARALKNIGTDKAIKAYKSWHKTRNNRYRNKGADRGDSPL